MPGGVCAVLDYEVEQMAEYIAEMATRLALGEAVATLPFRKFLSQVLSSTRLPSTTILLGMNYLAKRLNTINPVISQRPRMSEGHVWRMTTVALLLGSKFLDDNTFQNRSWAEVSGIPVRELNTLEYEWMAAIQWRLYVNLDKSKDYNAWLKNWKQWSEDKKRQQALANRERLASLVPAIDTDLARSQNPLAYASWHQQQVAEYERLSSMKRTEEAQQQGYRPREASWSSYPPAAWTNAPLTPPDSGYGTPDYLNSAAAVNSQYNDWFSQQAQQSHRANASHGYGRQHQYQQAPAHNAYHARNPPAYPPYSNFYGHSIWEHNVVDCNCMSCAPCSHQKQQPYFGMPHSFGQPVVG